jgi:beta-galactosidase GanA
MQRVRICHGGFQVLSRTAPVGIERGCRAQTGDFSGYHLILVPPLSIVRPEFLDALRRSSGLVLFGSRLGSKTINFQIPENLPPGPFQEFLALRVLRVESLPRFAQGSSNGTERPIRPRSGWNKWPATRSPLLGGELRSWSFPTVCQPEDSAL